MWTWIGLRLMYMKFSIITCGTFCHFVWTEAINASGHVHLSHFLHSASETLERFGTLESKQHPSPTPSPLLSTRPSFLPRFLIGWMGSHYSATRHRGASMRRCLSDDLVLFPRTLRTKFKNQSSFFWHCLRFLRIISVDVHSSFLGAFFLSLDFLPSTQR